MTRRGAPSSDTSSGSRKRKSVSERLKPVLAETDDAPAPDAAGDPLTLDARPYAPKPRRASPKLELKVQRPGRIVAAVAVTLAVGGAVTVGVVQAMNAHGHRLPIAAERPLAVARNAAAVAATPAVAAVEARPLTEYQPPDREQVSSAYLKVGATYRSEGLSGVVRQSMDCFSSLKQTPSYATLDFCIAADAFGEALQRKLTADQPPASDSYFAGAASRELEAARTVVGADGDAGARVLDVHRLAGEVSQAGSGAAQTLVAENDRTPPAAIAAPREEPAAAPVETPPVMKALPKPAIAVVHAQVAHDVVAPPVRAVTRKTAPPRAIMLAPRLLQTKSEPAPSRHAHPRLETVSAPAHASHPSLVKTHARAEPTVERPRITRASTPVKPSHVRTRFAEDDARDTRKPARQHFAAASKPRITRHAARDDDQDSSPPWAGAIRAIRASLTARNDQAARRASEPTEWVDCRHPRTPAEIRMCDGPASGDGTLQGQYRSGSRNR